MRTLNWRSLGGAEYRLEIQDGMDEVRRLVGGASPFVTSTDDDDDFFAAVRSTTGAICVIGDVAEVEELVTGVPADKLVELYAKKSDGTDLGCVWRGFLQTTAYSQAWNKGPLQFSLPVVSPLGVLDSFYPKADVVAETWSFAEFLVNANKAKEGMLFWDGFVFPASCNPEQTLMYRMQMQNFGTYDEKQERWHVESYMMILQEVCKLFGWACQEWNNKLVFLSADDTTEYLGYRADRLEQKIETGVAIVENIRVETTAETIWGAEHQLDYIDGKKSVEVTGEVNAYTGDAWSLNFGGLDFESADSYLIDKGKAESNLSYRLVERYSTLNYINNNVKFENWKNGNDTLTGFGIVRERFETGKVYSSTPVSSDYEKPFDIYDSDSGYKDMLLLHGTNDEYTFATSVVSNNIYFTSKLRYTIKGALKIAEDRDSQFVSTENQTIGVDILIGGVVFFTGDVISDSNGDFSLDFYPNIAGIIEIKIKAPGNPVVARTEYYSIENLSIEIACDSFGNVAAKSENKKERKTNNGYTSEYNIKCNLTCYKLGQAGYGIVLARDVKAEPPVSLNVSGERPEVHLADRLWRYYKQSRKKLTVQLKMDGEGLNPMNLHSFSEAVPRSTGDNSEAVPQSTEIRGMACLAQTIDWAEDMVTAALFEV